MYSKLFWDDTMCIVEDPLYEDPGGALRNCGCYWELGLIKV